MAKLLELSFCPKSLTTLKMLKCEFTTTDAGAPDLVGFLGKDRTSASLTE